MNKTLILAAFLLLSTMSGSYADNEQPPNSATPDPRTKQIECMQKVTQMQLTQSGNYANLSLKLMQENKSDIPLQIMERRGNEKLCMAELLCYGQLEPAMQGVLFTKCLNNLEHDF